jgi:GTP-binding protein
MYNWIKHYNYSSVIVATKIDKLTKTELRKNLNMIKETLRIEAGDELLTFSSLNKQGKEELLEVISRSVL